MCVCELDWFVEKGGDKLLVVAVGGAESHDSVLDREGVHMVEHHVLRLGQ